MIVLLPETCLIKTKGHQEVSITAADNSEINVCQIACKRLANKVNNIKPIQTFDKRKKLGKIKKSCNWNPQNLELQT